MNDIKIIETLDRFGFAIAKRPLHGDMVLIKLYRDGTYGIYGESKFRHKLIAVYKKRLFKDIKTDKKLMDNLEDFTLEELQRLSKIK